MSLNNISYGILQSVKQAIKANNKHKFQGQQNFSQSTFPWSKRIIVGKKRPVNQVEAGDEVVEKRSKVAQELCNVEEIEWDRMKN